MNVYMAAQQCGDTRLAHDGGEQRRLIIYSVGNYPGRYNTTYSHVLYDTKPELFIAGPSHILRVMFDKSLQCLYINPGAAGKSGFHLVRTLVRFTIDGTQARDLEVIELGGRSGGVVNF